MVGRLWLKFKWYVRKHGLMRLAWLVLLRLWRTCINNRSVMFYLDLERLGEDPLVNAEGLTLSAYCDLGSIPGDDMRQLVQLKGEETLLSFLDSFFRRGAVLWLGRMDERVVALEWTIQGGFNGFFHFPMTGTDVVQMAAEVFPAYRGRGIHTHMNRLMFQQLRANGVSRVYWAVKVWNRSSLRSVNKLNAMRIGIVRTFSLFNRWITVWDKRSLTEVR